jgi:hypothetical protein
MRDIHHCAKPAEEGWNILSKRRCRKYCRQAHLGEVRNDEVHMRREHQTHFGQPLAFECLSRRVVDLKHAEVVQQVRTPKHTSSRLPFCGLQEATCFSLGHCCNINSSEPSGRYGFDIGQAFSLHHSAGLTSARLPPEIICLPRCRSIRNILVGGAIKPDLGLISR